MLKNLTNSTSKAKAQPSLENDALETRSRRRTSWGALGHKAAALE
jgi:hypothetical protein